MKSNDINFINYTTRGKGNVKNLIAIVIIINIFLIGNFVLVFSDIFKNYINLQSGQYERVTGDVTEATYFSDTSSSLKVKYKYINNIIERRIISNKYYKEGTKVELLLNKNDNTDVGVISLESTYRTIEWIVLITILLDMILLFVIIARVKRKNTVRTKSIRYNEIKNINSVMLSKNKIDEPIEFFVGKYKRGKIKLSSNFKKLFTYACCIVIILLATVKFSLVVYENYSIKNNSSWNIISAKVSEVTDTSKDIKTFEPENFRYTFDFYYKGVKQKVSLRSGDIFKDGEMIDLAIKNGDISTVRKAEEKLNVANYFTIVLICLFLMYITYHYKNKKYQ